jgi:hypothetical protein
MAFLDTPKHLDISTHVFPSFRNYNSLSTVINKYLELFIYLPTHQSSE